MLAMLVLAAFAHASTGTLVLPPGEHASAWRTAASLAGLTVIEGGISPGAARLERSGSGWAVNVTSPSGVNRTVTVAAPNSEGAREEITTLAASLLADLSRPEPGAEGGAPSPARIVPQPPASASEAGELRAQPTATDPHLALRLTRLGVRPAPDVGPGPGSPPAAASHPAPVSEPTHAGPTPPPSRASTATVTEVPATPTAAPPLSASAVATSLPPDPQPPSLFQPNQRCHQAPRIPPRSAPRTGPRPPRQTRPHRPLLRQSDRRLRQLLPPLCAPRRAGWASRRR